MLYNVNENSHECKERKSKQLYNTTKHNTSTTKHNTSTTEHYTSTINTNKEFIYIYKSFGDKLYFYVDLSLDEMKALEQILK